MFTRKTIILLAICFMLFGQNLFSQIVLEGVVTDNGAEYLGNGAEPVVNALVTLTDQANAQRTFSDYTNDQGQYSFEISSTSVDDPDANNPVNFTLLQNYPNPFNPSTIIGYELNKPSHISIDIYNLLGQKIRTLVEGYQTAGPGQVMWDASNDAGQGVPAGVYIYSLRGEGINMNKKMLLIDGQQGSSNLALSPSTAPNASGLTVMKKQLSDQYTLTVTGTDIASWEQQNLEITGNMTLDITVTRTITGNDGKTYTTVRIGDQWWMAENLKETQYRNGDAIPEVTDDVNWSDLSTGARCAYNNDANNESDTYGYLYNWYAVDDSRHIAPAGWHVPTDEEWKELEMYLGMSQSEADDTEYRGTNQGSKLAGNASLWEDGYLKNNDAFGISGFSALPGGYRHDYNGTFGNMGYGAYFWSSTEFNSDIAWYRILLYYGSEVYRHGNYKRGGFSVRFVRD